MTRLVASIMLLFLAAESAKGQLYELVSLDSLQGKLAGRLIDHTQNHGEDRRLFSPILGMSRDLYVYLPPGYNPAVAYPLIVFLHTADMDEHGFLEPDNLKELDRMMAQGEMPPAVVCAPDGTLSGRNRLNSTHSLWVNGNGGRFEDHLVFEVVPFMMRTYSIRPERQGHALLGLSAGGYGAMVAALKHRATFGVVASMAAPLNIRYDDCARGYRANFNPATYRERLIYDPNTVIAINYGGLMRRRVKAYLDPIYGDAPDTMARIARDNPADLLATTNLRPGELAIYVSYPERDNFNFDAQDQSFAWIAAQRGILIAQSEVPRGRHNLRYFKQNQQEAYRWLGAHILPPVPR